MFPVAVAAPVQAKVPAEAAVPAGAVKAPAVEAALEKANKLLQLTAAGRPSWELARRFFQANVVSGTKRNKHHATEWLGYPGGNSRLYFLCCNLSGSGRNSCRCR